MPMDIEELVHVAEAVGAEVTSYINYAYDDDVIVFSKESLAEVVEKILSLSGVNG